MANCRELIEGSAQNPMLMTEAELCVRGRGDQEDVAMFEAIFRPAAPTPPPLQQDRTAPTAPTAPSVSPMGGANAQYPMGQGIGSVEDQGAYNAGPATGFGGMGQPAPTSGTTAIGGGGEQLTGWENMTPEEQAAAYQMFWGNDVPDWVQQTGVNPLYMEGLEPRDEEQAQLYALQYGRATGAENPYAAAEYMAPSMNAGAYQMNLMNPGMQFTPGQEAAFLGDYTNMVTTPYNQGGMGPDYGMMWDNMMSPETLTAFGFDPTRPIETSGAVFNAFNSIAGGLPEGTQMSLNAMLNRAYMEWQELLGQGVMISFPEYLAQEGAGEWF